MHVQLSYFSNIKYQFEMEDQNLPKRCRGRLCKQKNTQQNIDDLL